MNVMQDRNELPVAMPDLNGGLSPCPTIMTEEELIRFLGILEISTAANHHHGVENLKRMPGLPRIHRCGKTVYLTDAVKQWLTPQVICG